MTSQPHESMGRPGFHVMGWKPCTCKTSCALTDADLSVCGVNCAGLTTDIPVLIDVTLTLEQAHELLACADDGSAHFTAEQAVTVREAMQAITNALERVRASL